MRQSLENKITSMVTVLTINNEHLIDYNRVEEMKDLIYIVPAFFLPILHVWAEVQMRVYFNYKTFL